MKKDQRYDPVKQLTTFSSLDTINSSLAPHISFQKLEAAELIEVNKAWLESKKLKKPYPFKTLSQSNVGNVVLINGGENNSNVQFQLDCHGFLNSHMGRVSNVYFAPLSHYYSKWKSLEELMDFIDEWYSFAHKSGYPIQFLGIFKGGTQYYVMSGVMSKDVVNAIHNMGSFYWHRYLYEYNQPTTAKLMLRLFQKGMSFYDTCAISHTLTLPRPNHHTFVAPVQGAVIDEPNTTVNNDSLIQQGNGYTVYPDVYMLIARWAGYDYIPAQSKEFNSKHDRLWEVTMKNNLKTLSKAYLNLIKNGTAEELSKFHQDTCLKFKTISTLIRTNATKKTLENDAKIIHSWLRP